MEHLAIVIFHTCYHSVDGIVKLTNLRQQILQHNFESLKGEGNLAFMYNIHFCLLLSSCEYLIVLLLK